MRAFLNPLFYIFLIVQMLRSLKRSAHRFLVSRLASGVIVERGVHVPRLDGLYVGDGATLREDAEILLIPDAGGHGRVTLGRRVKVGKRALLTVRSGEHLSVGDFATLHNGCVLIGDVTIGRYCVFAPNVYISSGNHEIRRKPAWLMRDQDEIAQTGPERSKPVVIEEDCWIGWGVFIKSGITVGKGAVIGANSVVTHDVAPYAIVGGAPATVIGSRLDFAPAQEIRADNPDHLPYFYSGFRVKQSDLEESRRRGVVDAESKAQLVFKRGAYATLTLEGKLSPGTTRIEMTIAVDGNPAGTLQITSTEFAEKLSLPRPAADLAGPLRVDIDVFMGGYGISAARVA